MEPGPAQFRGKLRLDVALLRRQHRVRVAGQLEGRGAEAGPVGIRSSTVLWARRPSITACSSIRAGSGAAPTRAKIERFFRTVRQQFLAPLDTDQLAGIADLDQRLHTWLESEYHRSPHRGLKGATPLETWLAKCHLIVPLDPTGDLAVAFRHQATRKVYRDSTVTLDGVLFELPSTLIGAHLSRDRGGIVVARPGAARHRAVVRPGHRTRVAVPPHEPVTNAAPRSYSMIAPIMLPSPRRRPGSRKTTRSCERSSVWILGTDMPGSFRGVVLGRPMEARRWQYSPFGVSAILRIP